MRSNLKYFDNQKAFSAFVGFTIKTLSTRSYAMAEALEMHLLKKFGINEMFRIDVSIRLDRVTSSDSYTHVLYYNLPKYVMYLLFYSSLEYFLRFFSKIN